mmetsp:Transcript_30573/g.65905  ORF Transcript_30573/g.65905 Transcript_30573/m.65905 type:complete len:481 (-) Transcript_30573:314-1756(-)
MALSSSDHPTIGTSSQPDFDDTAAVANKTASQSDMENVISEGSEHSMSQPNLSEVSDETTASAKKGIFGGYGCLVFAGFLNHWGCFGPMYSFGLFVPIFKDEFSLDLEVATSLVSMMQAMQFFGSLSAGLLIPNKISHRKLSILSSWWSVLGYIGAALAQDELQMRICLSFGVGLALGAANLSALTALQAELPMERRPLCVGLATCGATLGNMVLPRITSWALITFGWRPAMAIMGLSTSLILVCAAPMFKVSAANLPPQMEKSASWGGRVRRYTPCLDPAYLCWWLNTVVCFFGWFAPLTLLAQYTQEELNMPAETAAIAYMIVGGAGAPVRAILGLLANRIGGARRIHLLSQFMSGVVGMFLPFCRTAPSLYVWAVFYGIATSPLIALVSVVLGELFGIHRLPLLHGFSRCATGLGSLVGPPFIALIVNSAGYTVAFVVAGCFVSGATLFLMVLPYFHKTTEQAETKKIPPATLEMNA